ncbi:MAG: hypothetical protein KDA91_06765 [Planctomycetaceae bacterium]|nr:hypothetical protein [Planctomycetaceae bacterium]
MKLSGHELVGQRLVGQMPSRELVDLWCRVTSRIVKYGFSVTYADLEAPRTGIFNGIRITLDPDVDFEMQCFILLHLFGHSVQWVAPSLEKNLHDLQHTTDKELFLKVLKSYEFEAARLGMQLMHESGITQLDQWYSDFVETDWRYVRHYYLQGEIPDWTTCRAHGCEIIQPMPIPTLQLKEVAVRFAF